MQGLETFADVAVHQTSDEEFCARYPCAKHGCERAGRQQGAHAKACPAETPCRQRTHGGGQARRSLKHGKVLVEAIAAIIEPLEFRRKVERKMPFDIAAHDPETHCTA